MTHSLNELINDGGDCRTAPATQGLLKKELIVMATLITNRSETFFNSVLPKNSLTPNVV